MSQPAKWQSVSESITAAEPFSQKIRIEHPVSNDIIAGASVPVIVIIPFHKKKKNIPFYPCPGLSEAFIALQTKICSTL